MFDLGLVLQFDGDWETLMGDFLVRPPPVGEDREVIVIAMAIDVSHHLECGGAAACAANVPRWLKGALGKRVVPIRTRTRLRAG
jgi:hypothetical protein